MKLHQMGINAVGTIMSNRKGLTNLVKFTTHDIKTSNRGALKMCKCDIVGSSNPMLAIGWIDTKPVYMIATGVASTAALVLRRLKGGSQQALPACRPLVLYHKYMGGVDNHDYMRMGRYSLQKSFQMRHWPKTMFLSLIDLCLVNAYVLWKLIHNGTSMMRSREDFYQDLAEEMYNYSGFSNIINTRSTAVSTPRKTPSKNVPSTPKTQGSIRGTYAGHCSVEFEAKPKITRHNKKQIEDEWYKYGSGGRNGQYRNCFVCQRIGTKRSLTKEYCDECKLPVCSSRHLKTSKDGDAYICWNELHTNECVIEAARKKSK